MATCPFCKATLSNADLDSGTCSTCSRPLPPALAGGHPPASGEPTLEGGEAVPPPSETEKGTAEDDGIFRTLAAVGGVTPPLPPEHPTGAADEPLVGETVAAVGGAAPPLPPPPAPERETGTADSHRIAQTLAAAGDAALPSERENGTADSHRIAETLAGARDALPPTPEREKGTADDRRIAATLAAGVPQPEEPPAGKPAADESHRFAKTLESGKVPPDLEGRVSMVWSGKFHPATTPRTSIKVEAPPTGPESNLLIQPRVLRDAKAAGAGQADYLVVSKLGQGGQGVILIARQTSIDRQVVVKKLQPQFERDPEARRKFLYEAVVTGDLEHPNIVPIYDLGKDEDDLLFYSMKHVKGTTWDEVIGEKAFHENLEILMKVADAVGFAHSKGVVHRDLKPENVMIGGFGEVQLIDCGLALSVNTATMTAGMAGTPAYMAPEMATGPLERIGFASDVYLLGAILFEIITGKPPHTGDSVLKCLWAAAKNDIQPTEKTGELLSIALKAMSTRPEDRYSSVGVFQNAVREYFSHSESISLSTRAEEELKNALESDKYDTYAQALFGFREAYELWDGNTRAKEGIAEAGLAYARSALKNGDYDLGASLLDPELPEHAEALREIQAARRERDSRQQRLKVAKRVGAALVATVLLVITAAIVVVWDQRNTALAAKKDAETQTGIAQDQTKIANDEKTKAQEAQKQTAQALTKEEKARKAAQDAEAAALAAKAKEEKARKAAQDAEAAALAAKAKEEYGGYITRIGLAAAKIEENAFEGARELLSLCPEKFRDWEWKRLMHLCAQDYDKWDAEEPIEAVAYSPDGKRFAAGGRGTIHVWAQKPGKDNGRNFEKLRSIATGGQYVLAVAFSSPDGKHIAAGTNDKPNYVKIWDVETGNLVRELPGAKDGRGDAAVPGHTDGVLSVAYSRDGKRLLTSSFDKTVRVWDLETGASGVSARHEEWVWSAAFSPDEDRIVTACQDGSAAIWPLKEGGLLEKGKRIPLSGHSGPVYAAAFSPNGEFVATAGYDKRVLLWKVGQLKAFNYGALAPGRRSVQEEAAYEKLEGHTAGVRSVRFSADGRYLLSSGDDNTVRVWDVAARRLVKALRGHSSPVPSCTFTPSADPSGELRVLSGSQDHTVKLWSIADYEEERLMRGHADAILRASFSSKGDRVVSASRDRTAKIWDVATGRQVGLPFQEGHGYLATTAIFFNDGKSLVTAGVDNTTRIWDVASGAELVVLEKTGPSAAVAVSRDGTRILTGSDDMTAKLWDATDLRKKTDRLLHTLAGHKHEVKAVALSPDGRWLWTGDNKGRCRLWDAKTGRHVPWKTDDGKELWETEGHGEPVTAAAFLPSGRVLTASLDFTVAQWDIQTGRQRPDQTLKHPAGVTSMALSRDGRHLLTTCVDKSVRLWDVAGGRQVAAILAGPDGVFRLWDPKAAATVDKAKQLRIRSLREESNKIEESKTLKVAGGKPQQPAGAQVQTLKEIGDELRRLEETVNAAVFSEDGNRIAVTSSSGTVRLWDLPVFQGAVAVSGGCDPSLSFKPATSTAWSAIFSPDGARVLTVGGKDARLWDITSKTVEGRNAGLLRSIAWAASSADGKRLVTGGDANTVSVWHDWAEAKPVEVKLEGHAQRVTGAVFSPDGKRLVTVSDDKTARLWNVERATEQEVFQGNHKKLLWPLQGHADRVLAAAFSPDGSRVVTASADKTARIWNAETGRSLHLLEGHAQAVAIAGFSADGKELVTGSLDKTITRWDAGTGRKQASWILPDPNPVTSMSLSGDSRRILTTGSDRAVRLWDAGSGRLIAMHTAGEAAVAASFSRDGNSAVVMSSQGTATLWDLQALPEIITVAVDWRARNGQPWAGAFAGDGAELLIAAGNDVGRWKLSDLRKSRQCNEVIRFSPHESVASANFSPDGSHLVTASLDGTAKIWDVAKTQKLLTLQDAERGHRGAVNDAVFSPDGNKVVTVGNDGKLILWVVDWAAKTGKMSGVALEAEQGSGRAHEDRIRSVAFSPAGDRILTASDDKTARIWDAEKGGKPLFVLQGHTQAVLCAAFSGDGKYVVTGSADNTAKLWEAETGKALSAHDAVTGEELQAENPKTGKVEPVVLVLKGHTSGVTSVALSTDAKGAVTRAITGSRDSTAKIWDARNGNEILTLKGHSEEVTAVAFSPDKGSQKVLTSSRDGTLILWLTDKAGIAAAKQDTARGRGRFPAQAVTAR